MDTLPQIQTIIQEYGPPISTVINAPWVSVTSVNGMTGDVVVELILSDFQPNHYYVKNTAVLYQGSLYYAKQSFTSGNSFNLDDWTFPQFSQEQANWNTTEITANSYIKNKPTKLSQFSNDSDFITTTQTTNAINSAIETATDPIFEEVETISTNVGNLSSTVSGLSSNIANLTTSVNNKVDKEIGKGLSTNDFTDDYKELLDKIKSDIFEQTYPVGSIYTSTTISTSTGVAEALGGGTWEAYGEGRVMVGKSTSGTFSTIGATGGSSSVTLSENQLPIITGSVEMHSAYNGTNLAGGTGVFSSSIITSGYYRTGGERASGSQSISNLSFSVGGGSSHTNLQPYVVVYMWRRTA